MDHDAGMKSEEYYIQQVLRPVTEPPAFDPYVGSLIDINLEEKLIFLLRGK